MKLYFRYGTVNSAKTTNLLAVTHNYQMQGKKVFLCKPSYTDHSDKYNIKSQSGLSEKANMLIEQMTPFNTADIQVFAPDCILVDDAHLLNSIHVDQFRHIVDTYKIPVICYGIKTDFKKQLFSGSQRLLELCDSIEEVKTTCFFCNRKATQILKFISGKPTLEGTSTQNGKEVKYFPCCHRHYEAKTKDIPGYVATPLKRDQFLLEEKMPGIGSKKIITTSPNKIQGKNQNNMMNHFSKLQTKKVNLQNEFIEATQKKIMKRQLDQVDTSEKMSDDDSGDKRQKTE